MERVVLSMNKRHVHRRYKGTRFTQIYLTIYMKALQIQYVVDGIVVLILTHPVTSQVTSTV